MQYVLLMSSTFEVAADSADLGAPTAWIAEMERRGAVTEGARLRPAEEARTVRVRNGETLWTHGPYAELQEQVGGYDVIEAADLDEAIEIASKHPWASFGAIEVRPLWQQE